ncbi:MAG: SusF/SusE family outer membrane protein [Bacteroidales bacterium]|nr:SusF/SusE family outer membrane protein [Bacteroidales bacterium]
MKKIFNLLLIALALPFMAACDEDRDSNPTFHEPTTFELNVPAYATNNIYDLRNADVLELTVSQPDYGTPNFPLSTVYTTEVSLDGVTFQALPTTLTNAKMEVPASEINDAIIALNGDEPITEAIPLYVRVRANLYADPTLGIITSNVVTLPNVLPFDPNEGGEVAALPTTMHIVGDFAASRNDAGEGWAKFYELTPAYGLEGYFYGVVYLQAGAEFKFNPDAGWQGRDRGFGQIAEFDDQAGAGIVAADDTQAGSNIVCQNTGWYTIVVEVKAKGEDIAYTVRFLQPRVYIFGATAGDVWEYNADWMFSVPAEAFGSFESPALAAAGEVRIAVRTTTDWWRTELTLKDGTDVVYRTMDIPANWNDNVGPEYSIAGAPGKVVKINFTTNTGSVE